MRRLILALLGLCLSSLGCTPSTEERIALAKLSQSCAVNSDCAEPLVCAFGSCHSECGSSRDCDPGLRCVKSDLGTPVCQLPSEVSCKGPGECPGDQTCGLDAECRDGCRSARDCVAGQNCVTGTCADPEELTDDGALPISEERSSAALPCALNSDCAESEVCREGSCVAECRTSADCPLGRGCDAGRCVSPASGCVFSNECSTDERCESGRCSPLPEPAECEYDSDCSGRETKCSSGVCACECATTDDCPRTFVCADACTCEAGRIVEGFLQVENLRQFEELLDVAEFRGVLILAIPLVEGTPARLRLPHLRRVDALYVAGGYLGELILDSLETVPDAVYIYAPNIKTFAAPRLVNAGQVSLGGASKLETLDLPELKTAVSVSVYNLHPELDALSFPKLEKVSGAVQMSSTGPTVGALSLPALTSVGQLVFHSTPGLATFNVPKLERVDGDVTLHDTGLTSFSVPTLGKIGTSLVVTQNAALADLSLPALEEIGLFEATTNPVLSSLDFSGLVRGTSIVLSNNPQLAAANFPSCTRVASAITVSENAGLTDVSFPVLTDTLQLTLIKNGSLDTVAFPLLASVEDFSLTDATPLIDFDLSSLVTASSSFTVIGNAALSNLASVDRSKAGSLASAGHVTIQSNAALPACLVADLEASLDTYASFNAAGNGGVCP